jgi:hypothetical protein
LWLPPQAPNGSAILTLIEEAMKRAELGDSRRTARAMQLVATIVEGQTSDTNAACGAGQPAPWPHSMGAYRLFNNEAVSLPQMHSASIEALRRLVEPHRRCYVAHDFSVVDYSKHTDKSDRVQVGNEAGLGYDLYCALVLNAAGQPLGPVVTELRNSRGCLSSEADEPIPFVDHLSQAERGIAASCRHLPDREIVHLLDREFDDVALQRFVSGERGLYVNRAQHLSRIVRWGSSQAKLGAIAKAVPHAPAGQVERDGKQFERFIGETIVSFDRPSLRGCKRGNKPQPGAAIDVRIVLVELRGSGHREHHEWVLLTNLSADEQSAEAVVDAYLMRWRIERFFYLAKVGLRLEQWRQRTGEALARRLALTMLAAMVIYQLLIAKDDPAIRAIATLGGWLGRKRDSLGPVVMMRGVFVLIAALSAVATHGVEGLLRLAEQAGLGFAIPAALRSARAPPRGH